MMIFIKNISWFCLSVSSTPLSIHPSVSTAAHFFMSLFYHQSMYAFHLAANEREMERWRREQTERKMAFGPSVERDEQMWERDGKRKTEIIAAFNKHLEP